ncbi:MAG TPA: hypothetical protein VMZ11_02400 [Mycobacteriales bacterium]|nr:hypothetical protein [Mycobacteriales bacterium]
MGTGVEILQGVLVLGTLVDGADVHVDLYGSASNICGSVRFTFEQTAQRDDMVAQLEEWAGSGTSLTYVQRGSSVTLQDDTALFDSLGSRS